MQEMSFGIFLEDLGHMSPMQVRQGRRTGSDMVGQACRSMEELRLGGRSGGVEDDTLYYNGSKPSPL